MKKRKLLVSIGVVGLSAVMLSTAAFAASVAVEEEKPTIKYIMGEDGMQRVSDKDFYERFGSNLQAQEVTEETSEVAQEMEKPMLRFYLGENGLYQLSEVQYQEALSQDNFSEVVARDNLKPVDSVVSDAAKEVTEPVSIQERKSGKWTITDSVIRDGYRKTYFMPDGSSFVVDDGEEVIFSIEPDKACWLTFGSTGTKNYTDIAYVDKETWFGITIATDTAGSYKFFAENTDNGFDVTVDGVIEVQ